MKRSKRYGSADGPTRGEGLGELPRLLSDLPMVIHERLAHGGVLASRSIAFDVTAATPSAAAHLDIALDQIAPGPGRPPERGVDPAPPVSANDSAGADAVAKEDEAA